MTAPVILSPRLLVAAISAFGAVVERERWAQPGLWAQMVRRQLGVPPEARWDAALVQHCGYWSHYDHETDRSRWPIPRASSAEDFVAFGRRHHLLRTDASPGDILLQYSPARKTYVRAGVVVKVVATGWWTPNRPYIDVLSVEGDAGNRGELGGAEVFRVARRMSLLTGDRFLRWCEFWQQTGPVAAGRAA